MVSVRASYKVEITGHNIHGQYRDLSTDNSYRDVMSQGSLTIYKVTLDWTEIIFFEIYFMD